MPNLRTILSIVVISLVQVLVLNHVHLLHYATPMLIVYPLLFLRSDTPLWALPCIGFAIGLFNDMFTNTPGIGAFSLTAVAMMRPRALALCTQREDEEPYSPSRNTLGNVSYLLYATLLATAFCLIYYTIEAFTLFHWGLWLVGIVGSSLFTIALIMAIESVRKK